MGHLFFFQRSIRIASVVVFACVVARADTFTTLRGDKFEAQVKDLYGDTVLFGFKEGVRTLNLSDLDDSSLIKIATFLRSRPVDTPKWAQSSSRVAKSVARKLQVLQNGKWAPFDPGDRPEPEFYVLYYGAYWCGPCRRFSPRMVETYRTLKAEAADRFEVIFLSSDNDEFGQITYAKEVQMPWPVLKFSQARRVPVFEQWRASGIPSVVVITRDGDALFHSYSGEEYLGPDDPLTKFAQLLRISGGSDLNKPRPGRHRLAVAEHIISTEGDVPAPTPYLVGVERNKLHTLPRTKIRVQLEISAKGEVEDVEFLTPLDAVHKEYLRRMIGTWLFLPAVTGGGPRSSKVIVPLDFSAP
jgi:thiol-disulfide isomerase/thioredoxin